MTPEFGAASQLEKIDMLDFADFVAINKFDRKGAADALRDVRKQYQRNRELFKQAPDTMPVFGTIASRFNDDGVTALYQSVAAALAQHGLKLAAGQAAEESTAGIRARRARSCRRSARAISPRSPRPCARYHAHADAQARIARERQQLTATSRCSRSLPATRGERRGRRGRWVRSIDALIAERDAQARRPRRRSCSTCGRRRKAAYAGDEYVVKIRDKELRTALTSTSLSGTKVRKVALPQYEDDGEILRWQLKENVPGQLPVHRRRVRVQARERGPDAHVRRRRRPVPHQQALPSARRRHAGEAAVDRVRLGHAVRQRSRPAARHLRQGRQLRRVDRHARRHEGAVLGLRPVRAEQLGVDDDQRAGADAARDVHEHRDRPAAREVPRRQRPRADRRRGRRRSARGRCPRCAARCRPTSSRRTRARTPASSRPSSASR